MGCGSCGKFREDVRDREGVGVVGNVRGGASLSGGVGDGSEAGEWGRGTPEGVGESDAREEAIGVGGRVLSVFGGSYRSTPSRLAKSGWKMCGGRATLGIELLLSCVAPLAECASIAFERASGASFSKLLAFALADGGDAGLVGCFR